jgi:peptide/nickel transport system permease protein
MLRFLLVRLGQSLITVFLVLLVVFMVGRIAGDPIELFAGPDITPEQREEIKDSYGLNDPLFVQFGRFLGDIAHGDFGNSFRTNQPAMDEVLSRTPASLELAAASLLISVVIAVPLGILAAVRRGTVLDTGARVFALVGQAAPQFWVGLLLIFAFAVSWGLFPTGGRGGLSHLVLPAVTLGFAGAASIARLTRSSMLDVLHRDYITLAECKGLPNRVIIRKHAFRNAMLPVVTILGLRLGTILAGAVVVELIFSWPGVGRLIITSIQSGDYPVVQAAILLVATTVVLANLLTDVVYMFLDPRIRYGRTA